jgi:hypothetical protein
MDLISILIWVGFIAFGYAIPGLAAFKSAALVYVPEGRYYYFGNRYGFNDRFGFSVTPILNIGFLVYVLSQYFSDREFHKASRKYFSSATDSRIVEIERLTKECHDKKVKALEQELDLARKELY